MPFLCWKPGLQHRLAIRVWNSPFGRRTAYENRVNSSSFLRHCKVYLRQMQVVKYSNCPSLLRCLYVHLVLMPIFPTSGSLPQWCPPPGALSLLSLLYWLLFVHFSISSRSSTVSHAGAPPPPPRVAMSKRNQVPMCGQPNSPSWPPSRNRSATGKGLQWKPR